MYKHKKGIKKIQKKITKSTLCKIASTCNIRHIGQKMLFSDLVTIISKKTMLYTLFSIHLFYTGMS